MQDTYNPLDRHWRPIDDDIVVSVRTPESDRPEYGRVIGWNLSIGLTVNGIKPKALLEYRVEMLETEHRYWVPVSAIQGFIRSVG